MKLTRRLHDAQGLRRKFYDVIRLFGRAGGV